MTGNELSLEVVMDWAWKGLVTIGAIVGVVAKRELRQIEKDREKLGEIAEAYVDRKKFDETLATVHSKIEEGHHQIRQEIRHANTQTTNLLQQVLSAMLNRNNGG